MIQKTKFYKGTSIQQRKDAFRGLFSTASKANEAQVNENNILAKLNEQANQSINQLRMFSAIYYKELERVKAKILRVFSAMICRKKIGYFTEWKKKLKINIYDIWKKNQQEQLRTKQRSLQNSVRASAEASLSNKAKMALKTKETNKGLISQLKVTTQQNWLTQNSVNKKIRSLSENKQQNKWKKVLEENQARAQITRQQTKFNDQSIQNHREVNYKFLKMQFISKIMQDVRDNIKKSKIKQQQTANLISNIAQNIQKRIRAKSIL